ncbi:hypothetical protein ElyMa_003327800 [Elysia marginata]|uniref:Caveolin n=1 Tax=Elysia marginata TaxID=1093978 RepID=A0AAV4JJ28_9GAST|nr:hypothetical protein ElyMa_003327800 [Elysia marginata]
MVGSEDEVMSQFGGSTAPGVELWSRHVRWVLTFFCGVLFQTSLALGSLVCPPCVMVCECVCLALAWSTSVWDVDSARPPGI